jgi:hypothetical protein
MRYGKTTWPLQKHYIIQNKYTQMQSPKPNNNFVYTLMQQNIKVKGLKF